MKHIGTAADEGLPTAGNNKITLLLLLYNRQPLLDSRTRRGRRIVCVKTPPEHEARDYFHIAHPPLIGNDEYRKRRQHRDNKPGLGCNCSHEDYQQASEGGVA